MTIIPKLDLNDHSRLRHHRDRNIGFPTNQYIQPAPMLFNRDGLNMFMGDIYKGSSAFLILGGPSFGELLKEETEFNGKFVSNRELLNMPGFITMATNNAPRSFRTTLQCSVDDPQNFIKSIWFDPKMTKFVPFDHAEKHIFDNEKWEQTDTVVGECPNVHFYRRNEHFQPDQFLTEGTFNWGEHSDALDALGNKGGRSVMLVAIKLLYYLGIRKVFLLGCDFKMDSGSKYHFEQSRSVGSQKGNNATYEILKTRFESLLPFFEKADFKVFNCNLNSGLKVFPMIPFDEALKFATSGMPIIETERTEGLYDRKANQNKKVKVTPLGPISDVKTFTQSVIDMNKKEFTEEDKIVSKKELDRLRRVLDDMKHAKDTYKMMPDAKPENVEQLETAIINARKNFRDYEIVKNKVWGILKP